MTDDKDDTEQQVGRSKEDKQLDSVTDFHEDREIDSSKAKDALSSLGSKERKEQELEKQQRDKELAKVKVTKEDIEYIVNELEVDKFRAERLLRESAGDPARTVKVFLST
jgi:NACalpha-BTF3-like transcription factor